MKKNIVILISLALGFALSGAAMAQTKASAPPNPDKEAIENAAKNLYLGVAKSDMARVFENTSVKYANRKLTADRVRLPETGPKINIEWDQSVTIVRSDDRSAVVEANFYRPLSDEVPAGEVSRLRVYMEKQAGAWVASAPKRKQAGDDSGTGGWYHPGLFTFCPNRGIVFLPNHFSNEPDCKAVAACR